jgi:predicted membrane protein
MKHYVEKRFLAGVIMLTIGVILLLKYYNIFPELPHYMFSWKTLLIAIGMIFLITERNPTTGLILIVIGTVFLARDIFNISVREFFSIAIPVILIIIGLFLILRKQTYQVKDLNMPADGDSNNVLNDVSIFGGGERKVMTENFQGGKITAVFGGSEIDFRSSRLAPGINAIDMLCIFGGVTLRIPEDWEVQNDVTSIFGGFSDKRLFASRHPDTIKPDKVLYVKGLVIFGGGEIK